MGHSLCLQPRVTIGSITNGTVIQNEPLWGDFEVYQDAAFYLSVDGLPLQASAAAQPTLSIQTSPSNDPNFSNLPNLAVWNFAGTPTLGVQAIQYASFLSAAAPLCRRVRWQLSFATATLISFQIWVTLNPGPR